MQERQVVHEQCHYYLRGAQLDDYATLEEEDEDGKHVELYLDPQVQQAFLSTDADGAGNASAVHEGEMQWEADANSNSLPVEPQPH